MLGRRSGRGWPQLAGRAGGIYNPGWNLVFDLRNCSSSPRRSPAAPASARRAAAPTAALDYPETDDAGWGRRNCVVRATRPTA